MGPFVATKEKPFDFSLIEGWSVAKISTEHKRITEKKEAYAKSDPNKRPKDVKPLTKEEEKVLPVLLKKVEQWGKEYYEQIRKKVDEHQKRIDNIYKKIQEE